MLTFTKPTKKDSPQIFVVGDPKTIPPSPERKKHQNPLNFFYCIQSVYFVSRLFGFTPFSFKLNSKSEVIGYEVKPFDLVWFVISLFNYTAMAYLSWTTVLIPQLDVSYVLVIGNQLILVMGLLFGAFSVAFDMYNRQRLVDITRNFNAFDKKV